VNHPLPRIRRFGDRWACARLGCVGWGATPWAAYENWLRERDLLTFDPIRSAFKATEHLEGSTVVFRPQWPFIFPAEESTT